MTPPPAFAPVTLGEVQTVTVRRTDVAPSDLLSRAADLIRDVAASAFPGPWSNGERCVWAVGDVLDAVIDDGPEGNGGTIDEETARWIALLNPAVAPALERALRHEAGMIRTVCERGDPFYGPSPLLDLACAILGEEES